jgi:hypothetical protein
MQALFEGTNYWHMPKDVVMEVGPTISWSVPKQTQEDTERYGSQVKLGRTPEGGTYPVGYKAGLPFAEPLHGDPALAGARIFWDTYYRPTPRVEGAPGCSYTLDSYGNTTLTSVTLVVYSRLEYLSDAGYPITTPGGRGFWYAKYFQQTAPEQGKYSGTLILSSTDPTRLDEIYIYVPSLRRSLRLSQAARCAPVYATDLTYDELDGGPPGLPQEFEARYEGERKIVSMQHADPRVFASCGGVSGPLADYFYYHPESKGSAPWPSPGSGKWEVRDAYVVSLKRLPAFAKGYCYGNRVLYIDKNNFNPLYIDLFDQAGKLYKFQFAQQIPGVLPSTGEPITTLTEHANALAFNFQDEHATVFTSPFGCVDKNCDPFGYFDVERYASPAGLMKIQR